MDNKPEKELSKAGEYPFTLTDTLGCKQEYVLNLTIDPCEPKLEVPNVFTPNGDGMNDLFKCKEMEYIFDLDVTIVNQWGGKVFSYHGKMEDFAWDGKSSSGVDVPDGAYFYIILYKDVRGKKLKKAGSVTVLR